MLHQMTVEKAIKTAIEFEQKNQNLFEEASEKASLLHVKTFFQQLAEDEKNHVQYLHKKLKEWTSTGAVTLSKLASTFTSKDQIARSIAATSHELLDRELLTQAKDLPLLEKALHAEQEATRFYKELIKKLPETKQRMFDQLLKIEEIHETIVQKEIDFLDQ